MELFGAAPLAAILDPDPVPGRLRKPTQVEKQASRGEQGRLSETRLEFSIGQKRESEREFNARARTREKEVTQNRASRANNMRLHVGWKERVR